MSWKEYIKDTMKYKKPKPGWPETTPNYVGIANEEIYFPCMKEDDKTYFNYAMQETCKFVYGIVLRVAKYNGKYFFSCEKFYGDSFCSGACVVDIDRDLVKRFKDNVPEHAYFLSPNIDASRPKEEIVDFARTFMNYEVRNDPVLKEYAEGAVKLFAEAV